MKQKTLQQIFDKVARHLMKQGKRAVNDHGTCQYRGKDNTSCAVGCLIPNRFYDSKIENAGIDILTSTVPSAQQKKKIFKSILKKSGILVDMSSIRLMRELQACHDVTLIGDWKSKLIEIGSHHGFKLPKVLKV